MKGSVTVTSADVKGLGGFLKAMKGAAGIGVVLYMGERAFALRENIAAMPLSMFFGAEGYSRPDKERSR